MNGSQPGGNGSGCMDGQGSLPPCGPFATPFVVSQGPNPERFNRERALEQGTLFTDLNLPFHLKVNPGRVADTPLNQLRALDFVILELGLYLDTHPYDAEGCPGGYWYVCKPAHGCSVYYHWKLSAKVQAELYGRFPDSMDAQQRRELE